MSTYYNFYIGYKVKEDDKFHLYGPYDKFRNIQPCFTKSRSWISDLYHEFSKMNIDDMDDEIKEKFTYPNTYKEGEICADFHYLKICDLPSTNYIKHGYVRMDEAIEYLEDGDPYFSTLYSPDEYSVMLATAIRKNNTSEIDELKDMVFLSYATTNSQEYESFLIQIYTSWSGPFNDYEIENNLKENGLTLEDIYVFMEIN